MEILIATISYIYVSISKYTRNDILFNHLLISDKPLTTDMVERNAGSDRWFIFYHDD